mmetsp:Transcript_94482/g.249841  ORF Transcript_94482/g.249841 Transcript_94482/m.249841 type:complete len:459 (+) Transcript_94482:349-1725(+)
MSWADRPGRAGRARCRPPPVLAPATARTRTVAGPSRASADLLVRLQGHRLVPRGPKDVHGPDLVEEGLVLHRRVAPGELCGGRHGGLHHLDLLLRSARVDLAGAADCLGDRLARGVVQLSLHRHLRVGPEAVHAVLHGILQAAGGGDDGQGAHAHRLHLDQAAGLPTGWQQRVLAAGEKGVALRTHPASVEELLREFLLHRLSLLHKVGAAGAHDDHLHLGVLEHLYQALEQQVVALLRVQAADETHHGARGGAQAVLLLICGLQLRLGDVDGGGGEGTATHLGLSHEVFVLGGHTLLHAVQDAGNLGHGKEPLELHALLGVDGALRGVRGRHCERAVAVQNARRHGVHQLDLLVVLAHLQRHLEGDAVDVLLRHAEDLCEARLQLKAALEHCVVTQEEGLGVGPGGRVRALLGIDEHGHQRAVPVVGHHDHVLSVRVACQGQLPHGHERALAEVCKA